MNKPGFTWEEVDAVRTAYGLSNQEAEGFTIREYAARYGLPYPTACSQIERLVEEGRLIRAGRARRPGPDGVPRLVQVYQVAPTRQLENPKVMVN